MKVINSFNEIKWHTNCTVNFKDTMPYYYPYSIDFAGMVCR